MQNKTIVMIGVLDQVGSTNVPMAKSLLKLGFNVIPINYRTIVRDQGMQFFCNLVMSVVTQTKPYLVLICKGNGIPPQLLQEVNKYAKTWLYLMDARPIVEKCTDIGEHIHNCTFSSCTAHELVDDFNKKGANCFYLAQGVDPEVFKPVEPNKKYQKVVSGPVISMLGTKTKERDEYYKALTDAGFFPTFYGNGYGGEIYDKDFSTVCSSSDFMLSMNTFNGMHKGYFSNRLVRYLACGTCTLHFDPIGDLKNYFEDNKEIIFFKNKEELVSKLLNINEKDKISIGINGREKVLRDYTWDKKMYELITIVENKK